MSDSSKAGMPAEAAGEGGCVHCDAGHIARYRPETGEWVHDFTGRQTVSHTLCTAKREGLKDG